MSFAGGIVGIEFDTGIIRAVELTGTAKRPQVRAVGSVRVPDQAVVDGAVEDPSLVADGLRELYARARFHSRHVVLGLSGQGVLTRIAKFPRVAGAQQDKVIRYQAGEHFPIPVVQLVMDYVILGPGGEDEVEVLLVAARRELVVKGLAALEGAGLKPAVVDSCGLALIRALALSSDEAPAAIVDLAWGLSALLVVSQGVPRLSRALQVGLEDLAQTLQVPVSEVVGRSLLDDDVKRQLLGGWASELGGEIRASVAYYAAQTRQSVNRVILSGHGAAIAGLQEMLSGDLGASVAVAQLPEFIDLGSKQRSKAEQLVPEFAVCLGLALRGLEE